MEYSNYIFNHFLVTEETAKSIQQWPSRPEFSIALLKQLTKVEKGEGDVKSPYNM